MLNCAYVYLWKTTRLASDFEMLVGAIGAIAEATVDDRPGGLSSLLLDRAAVLDEVLERLGASLPAKCCAPSE
jgi:hypothetical protein